MAIILNIETSTDVCSVALTFDGQVVTSREDYQGHNPCDHVVRLHQRLP